uniref:hypothetical protein n=1 Tax=Klebsiella pneumoniae TaxID=573 RepID=UPI00195375E6
INGSGYYWVDFQLVQWAAHERPAEAGFSKFERELFNQNKSCRDIAGRRLHFIHFEATKWFKMLFGAHKMKSGIGSCNCSFGFARRYGFGGKADTENSDRGRLPSLQFHRC